MTEQDRQPEDTTAATGEPVVSKPYIMPDDPEPGSVELLQKEAAEARDRMLRTLAEMENLRKRTTKEVADARLYGITGFARDVLDIADNLQRALDAVPAEARATADPGLISLIEGVELTERFAAQRAGKARREEARSAGPEVRPELPPGDVRSA
ncbi:molecular chaperone GrpE (heat shock protein) [Bradyrhizobium ottawaense]